MRRTTTRIGDEDEECEDERRVYEVENDASIQAHQDDFLESEEDAGVYYMDLISSPLRYRGLTPLFMP
jgi:hypothetical protein